MSMSKEEVGAAIAWIKFHVKEDLGQGYDPAYPNIYHSQQIREVLQKLDVPVDTIRRLITLLDPDIKGRGWSGLSDHDAGIFMKLGVADFLPAVKIGTGQ